MNKRVLACVVFVALNGIVQSAVAQNPAGDAAGPKTSWYVGGGIGVTDSNIPDQTVNGTNASFSAAYGAAFSVVDEDSRGTGTKLFIGYKFNPNFAVEGGYAVLGSTSVNTDFRSGGAPSTSLGTFDLEYEMVAPFIDAVGILPLGEKWSLIGRIGVSYTRTSVDFQGTPLTLLVADSDKSENKARPKFGAGVDYNINASFSVRAEWERYNAPDPLSDDDFDIDTATVSLLYRF